MDKKPFQLRMSPELHKAIKIRAATRGIPMHDYIINVLDKPELLDSAEKEVFNVQSDQNS